jgi:hypothetical protein
VHVALWVDQAKGPKWVLTSGSHLKAPVEGIQFDNLSREKFHDPLVNYGQSKLANILFAKGLPLRRNSQDGERGASWRDPDRPVGLHRGARLGDKPGLQHRQRGSRD